MLFTTRRSKLTFYIQLSVNDVPHDRGVVQLLDRVLGSSGAGEQHPGQAQVLPCLGVKQDLHLLHLAELGAHFGQEGLLDVVIESSKGHLLEGYWTHVELIELRRKNKVFVTPGRVKSVCFDMNAEGEVSP